MDEDLTKEELYEQAQELDIEGRSQMDKEELAEAVKEAEGTADPESAVEKLAEWRENEYEAPSS